MRGHKGKMYRRGGARVCVKARKVTTTHSGVVEIVPLKTFHVDINCSGRLSATIKVTFAGIHVRRESDNPRTADVQ